MSNYCIRYYRSNNSLVLFSILLLVLVSRINLSILTRYSYSRNSNILYTEFYHISQGKSISCYSPIKKGMILSPSYSSPGKYCSIHVPTLYRFLDDIGHYILHKMYPQHCCYCNNWVLELSE